MYVNLVKKCEKQYKKMLFKSFSLLLVFQKNSKPQSSLTVAGVPKKAARLFALVGVLKKIARRSHPFGR